LKGRWKAAEPPLSSCDFKLLFAVSLLMLPLVLLMRRPDGSDCGQAGA
jgi:hypothetical protein